MGFPESITREIKRQAHFQCCLCKAIGVEIHHIVSQAEGGPDTLENGAPLCPSCHETYGANPTKRKFIREARDLWYEICRIRYASDPSLLKEVRDAVANTATSQEFSELRAEIGHILKQFKPPRGSLTVPVPRRPSDGTTQELDASDLMVLIYGSSSDRPVGQVEMLCMREFWPVRDGVRSIYNEFLKNFGAVALRRLASRAMDCNGILPCDGLTEDEITESLSLMSVEAACLNFLAKGEFRASLNSSGEVLWADIAQGTP